MNFDSISKRCHSCPREWTVEAPDAGEWNVEMKTGVPQWLLCPNCQTVSQNMEAEINYATLDYGTDAFGRVIAIPKGVNDEY